MTEIVRPQIDGVPEQLGDWEAEQKRKRSEDARDGKNKQSAGCASYSSTGPPCPVLWVQWAKGTQMPLLIALTMMLVLLTRSGRPRRPQAGTA